MFWGRRSTGRDGGFNPVSAAPPVLMWRVVRYCEIVYGAVLMSRVEGGRRWGGRLQTRTAQYPPLSPSPVLRPRTAIAYASSSNALYPPLSPYPLSTRTAIAYAPSCNALHPRLSPTVP
eukprot:3941271-Rhodomonas_salina.2